MEPAGGKFPAKGAADARAAPETGAGGRGWVRQLPVLGQAFG